MLLLVRAIKSAFLCLCLLTIFSCATKDFVEKPAGEFEKDMVADIGKVEKAAVTYVDIAADDFVITESPAQLQKYKDLEVSLNVRDIPLNQAITLLFKEYNIDHFITTDSAGRDGKISLTYHGSLQNLLNTLASQYGYYFSEENGVIRISDSRVYVFSIPPMITEMLSGGSAKDSGSKNSDKDSASAATGASSSGSQADDFLATLKNMGASETIIDQMNSLVSFKCDSSSLAGINAYLLKLRENVAVVSLEVLVAEVELSNEFSRGINWDILYSKNGDSGGFSLPLGLEADLKPGSLSFSLLEGAHWDIGNILSFLETQGNTEILQKPTITVLNGNRAFLRAGKEIPYVDEITITPTQIGTAVTFMQEVTFSSILEGIEIEILPKVQKDMITLSLRGAITGLLDFVERNIGDGGVVAKPISTTRDVQTVTAMKAGEILKIGGIIVSVDRNNRKAIPGSDVTGLTDFMFANRQGGNTRSEIVILVKPQIIRFRQIKG